jgi:chitinase
MAWIDTSDHDGTAADVEAAAQQLQGYLAKDPGGCETTTVFASSGAAVVGIYSGSQFHAQEIEISLLQQFVDQVRKGISGSLLVQYCATDHRGADFSVGIVANTNSNLSYVQDVVKTWSSGECVTAFDSTQAWGKATFWAPVPAKPDPNASSAWNAEAHPIEQRANCRTIQVAPGDGCGSLATKCGISGADFTKYNPSSTLCSTLTAGYHVCCSAGTRPDFKPKPNPDGSCFTHLIVHGDYCALLAATYDLTTDDLESFNKQTWGWTGCGDLPLAVNMCISTGTPAIPAPVQGVVCGPQVPGTTRPASGTSLASLNPCPLNACCDVYGQCGTTSEFCTESTSSTGAPGTAALHSNGCISNCGTNIITGTAPSTFIKVAYFEGFNGQRPCLNMDPSQIDPSQYTHIHFAFAEVTPEFGVNVTGVQEQFDIFVTVQGMKRILSFGGWSFSTDQDTSPIFRQGVTEQNRTMFISNLVKFVSDNKLDGLDFDWEYPGATDIVGAAPGSPSDGVNYFLFLSELRAALPSDISISIAAPASFWYLKGFPIKAMSAYLDYIVYMTYDLHGQWDYGNKNSDPGCPGGNCLRSHVNLTETINALSMITKAGVPATKVIVGVSSYGRSFKMTTPGCVGEMCTYEGPDSQATPGKCTGTAGYLGNGEIQDIILAGGNVQTFMDASDSSILVYDDLQWVSYMNDTVKNARSTLYKALTLGGTSDWAVDLQFDEDATGISPVCSEGSGDGDFADLCSFSCKLGYCPSEACSCSGTSIGIKRSVATQSGCPTPGNGDIHGNSFRGLCQFACSQGYCPSETCAVVSLNTSCPILALAESTTATLARLNSKFPGIYWDNAIPNGLPGDCTDDEFRILDSATYTAWEMVALSPNARPFMHDIAFHRYFVEDRWAKGIWRKYYDWDYSAIASMYSLHLSESSTDATS